MAFRSGKLLASARDLPCVICGSVGTTIAAHTNRVALGKGTGIKAPDYYVAFVCQDHHDQIDGRKRLDKGWTSANQMWEWAFIKTVEVWFKQHIVGVN